MSGMSKSGLICRVRPLVLALLCAGLLAACGRPAEDAPRSAPGETELRARIQAQARAALAGLRADAAAPMPALSAPVWRALAGDVPEAAAQRSRLEAAEQRALATLMRQFNERLDARLPQRRAGMTPAVPALAAAPPARSSSAWQRAGERLTEWLPKAHAQGLDADGVAGVITANATIGLLGGVGDLGKVAPGTDLSGLNGELKGQDGETATVRVTADTDGAPTVELASSVTIPLVLTADSKVSLTTTGLCPDAAGKLAFTLRLAQGGRAGSGRNVAYDREIEVKVSATVGEDAEIAEADMHTRQGERSTAGGRQVYVETATDWHVSGSDVGQPELRGHRLVRASSQANASDDAMALNGVKRALVTATAALQAAAARWQSGACIRIDAKSPGSVRPKASSAIPVRVLHRLEGGEVAARVKAALSGGASVAPELLAPAPGTITHVAPDVRRADMQIRLTANSRRGRAAELLKLSINEDQYTIEGGADEFHGTGVVCDLARPFTVEGSGVVVSFTPSSAQGGSYSYKGSMGGFAVWGEGTYTVRFDGAVATALVATGPGSVKTPRGVVSNTGTETYTLAPTRNGYCN